MRKIFGGLFLLAGIVLFFLSVYIKDQVSEGKGKIRAAQSKVDTGNTLFSITPQTKQAGEVFTDSAQRKINSAHGEVAYYAEVAKWCQIGGIGAFVLGLGIFFFAKKK